jgi:hypothetical protein
VTNRFSLPAVPKSERTAVWAPSPRTRPERPRDPRRDQDLDERWQGAILRGVQRLQAAGTARADLDAEQTAAALRAGIQGGVLLLTNTDSISHLQAVMTTGLDRMRV